MIDDRVARQIAQFFAVGKNHCSAAHPLDDLQAVTPAQQIEVAIRPAYDDARARGRLARLVPGEIRGEVRAPGALGALQLKRGKGDEGGGNDDETRGLYRHEGTT